MDVRPGACQARWQPLRAATPVSSHPHTSPIAPRSHSPEGSTLATASGELPPWHQPRLLSAGAPAEVALPQVASCLERAWKSSPLPCSPPCWAARCRAAPPAARDASWPHGRSGSSSRRAPAAQRSPPRPW
eukprot:364647-Chlamydomonas_euryale.AAC.26